MGGLLDRPNDHARDDGRHRTLERRLAVTTIRAILRAFRIWAGIREPIPQCRTLHSVTSELDETDWAAALGGDGEAFGRIFDRHRSRVYRHSSRLVQRSADIDDVVAVAFFEAWRRREDARFVDGSLLPWLLVIATNCARNVARSSRRYRALLARLPVSGNPVERMPDEDDSARRALAQLSLADRQVITLCILDGLSERETAEALGIASGTVKSRLSRAKRRLAGQLNSRALPNGASTKEEAHET